MFHPNSSPESLITEGVRAKYLLSIDLGVLLPDDGDVNNEQDSASECRKGDKKVGAGTLFPPSTQEGVRSIARVTTQQVNKLSKSCQLRRPYET